MVDDSASWYGWVPILSGDLFLSNYDDLVERAEDIKRKIEEGDDEGYSINYQYLGTGLNEWLINLRTQKEELSVKIQLEESGLYELTTINGSASYASVCTIHRFIRDVYHKHIHHTGDLPLCPVEAANKETGINGILSQYRQKVIYYHQEAQDLVRENMFEDAIDTIFSGRGEMQFAKSFSNLFFRGRLRQNLLQTFENSDNSLAVLLDKIQTNIIKNSEERKHNFNLYLTFFLTFLTLIGVLNTLPFGFNWKFNLLASFFAALMVLVFGWALTLNY